MVNLRGAAGGQWDRWVAALAEGEAASAVCRACAAEDAANVARLWARVPIAADQPRCKAKPCKQKAVV